MKSSLMHRTLILAAQEFCGLAHIYKDLWLSRF